jgi:hypothetical protein
VNKGLTTLDVSGCDLMDAGMSALGQALRVNRTLTLLKVDHNYFGLVGLKAFKGCLYGKFSLSPASPLSSFAPFAAPGSPLLRFESASFQETKKLWFLFPSMTSKR